MKRKISLKTTLTLMLAASALTCLIIALTAGRVLGLFSERFDHVVQFSALLSVIEERFIGDYDLEEISTAAMRAAVETLDDDWSYYMTPTELEDHRNRTSNRFTGIGVGVTEDENTGGIQVLYVHRGSAAETAGIIAGDVIIAVDGTDVTGFRINELRDILARPVDSTAEVTVRRSDGAIDRLTVVYGFVFLDPIFYEMLDDDIGYIAISNFNSGASRSFISAVDDLSKMGARALVFDVRGNAGGILNEMVGILDHIISKGEIFISMERNGAEQIIHSTETSYFDFPAVVLVNRHSYSAAEYFAATLREYGYAEIVGEQTSGKSRSQQIFELPRGGAVNISSAQYLTKNRVSLHDTGGLTPDYLISLSNEQVALLVSGHLDRSEDTQLIKALTLLTKQ